MYYILKGNGVNANKYLRGTGPGEKWGNRVDAIKTICLQKLDCKIKLNIY